MIKSLWNLPNKKIQIAMIIVIIEGFNKSFKAGILTAFLVLCLISIYNKENEKEKKK